MKLSTPQEAYQIADHTARAIASMRQCTTATDLRSQVGSWFVWAKNNGVCEAIKSHIRTVEKEMAARVRHDKTPEREVRNPAGADN